MDNRGRFDNQDGIMLVGLSITVALLILGPHLGEMARTAWWAGRVMLALQVLYWTCYAILVYMHHRWPKGATNDKP